MSSKKPLITALLAGSVAGGAMAQGILINESFVYPALADGANLETETAWEGVGFGDDLLFDSTVDFDGAGGSAQNGRDGGGSTYAWLQQTAVNHGVLSTVFSGYVGQFGDPSLDGFGNGNMVLFETFQDDRNNGYGIQVDAEAGTDTTFGTADDVLIFSTRMGGVTGTEITVDTSTFPGITDLYGGAYFFEGSYDSATKTVQLDLYVDNSGGTLLGSSSVTRIGYVWDPVAAGGDLDDAFIRTGDFGDTDFRADGLYLESIPEPGTFALIAGALSLGWVMIRRRRS